MPMHLLQVIEAERMLFHRNVVQASATRSSRSAPGLQCGEEIYSQPETGFEDDEARVFGPARGQIVAGQEDMAGLFQAALAGMVDIAVAW